jgi:hypothetical protein
MEKPAWVRMVEERYGLVPIKTVVSTYNPFVPQPEIPDSADTVAIDRAIHRAHKRSNLVMVDRGMPMILPELLPSA